MQRITITLFLCFFVLSVTVAQSFFVPTDTAIAVVLRELPTKLSLIEATSLSDEKRAVNSLDTALAYGYLALNIAWESRKEAEIVDAFAKLHMIYDTQGRYDDVVLIGNQLKDVVHNDSFQVAIDFRLLNAALRTQDLETAQKIIEDTDTKLEVMPRKMLSHFYSYKGIFAFIYQKEYIEALEYFQLSKDYLEDDPSMLTRINNNLAGIYDALGDRENTIALLRENIEIGTRIEDATVVLFSYINMAGTLRADEKYKEQFEACQKAVEVSERTGVTHSIGLIYIELGEYYLAKNQLDSAKYYFQKNIDINEQQNTTYLSGGSYVGLMKVYGKVGDYEQALTIGELAYETGGVGNYKAEENLANIYAALGQPEKAYELMTEGYNAQKAIAEDRSNQKLINKLIEDRYEQKQNEREAVYRIELREQRSNIVLLSLGVIIALAAIGMYFLFRSRRRLRKANNSLTERNEALKQFAYITSHDLKEPIRNITSFSNLLTRSLVRKEHSEKEKEYLGFVISNAGVLRKIVDSLEVFTKVSFGELELENISLQEVLLAVQDNLQPTIEEKKGQLEIIAAKEVDNVYFSKPMLVLVLQNIIQNGFKYNESSPPTVEVKVIPEGNKTRFDIRDNGIGIEPAYFDEIFSPFRTLTNKSISQSSGLGLSICKTILERYGGTITVSSDGNNGSTFSFVV